MGLGLKNQLFLLKWIDFSVLVPQKLSGESSINDDVYEKRVSISTYMFDPKNRKKVQAAKTAGNATTL